MLTVQNFVRSYPDAHKYICFLSVVWLQPQVPCESGCVWTFLRISDFHALHLKLHNYWLKGIPIMYIYIKKCSYGCSLSGWKRSYCSFHVNLVYACAYTVAHAASVSKSRSYDEMIWFTKPQKRQERGVRLCNLCEYINLSAAFSDAHFVGWRTPFTSHCVVCNFMWSIFLWVKLPPPFHKASAQVPP